MNGSQTLLRSLLHTGADANASKTDGCTPLIIAAQLGRTEVCQVLLAFGADSTDGTAADIALEAGFEALSHMLRRRTRARTGDL